MYANEIKEFFRVFLNEIRAIKTVDDVRNLPRFQLYRSLYEELIRRKIPPKTASGVIARLTIDVNKDGIEAVGGKMYKEIIDEFSRMLGLIYQSVMEEFGDEEVFLRWIEDMSLTMKA